MAWTEINKALQITLIVLSAVPVAQCCRRNVMLSSGDEMRGWRKGKDTCGVTGEAVCYSTHTFILLGTLAHKVRRNSAGKNRISLAVFKQLFWLFWPTILRTNDARTKGVKVQGATLTRTHLNVFGMQQYILCRGSCSMCNELKGKVWHSHMSERSAAGITSKITEMKLHFCTSGFLIQVSSKSVVKKRKFKRLYWFENWSDVNYFQFILLNK